MDILTIAPYIGIIVLIIINALMVVGQDVVIKDDPEGADHK